MPANQCPDAVSPHMPAGIRRAITAVVALPAVVALLLLGAPAGAAPDRGSFHDEDSSIIDCGGGLMLDVQSVNDGRFLGVQHGDGLWYYSEFWDKVSTVTNPDTGLSLTVRNWGLAFKDQTITDNGDGTLTIRSLSPAPVAIYAADGHMLSHFAGTVTYVFLVDDGGTPGDPIDDEFLDFVGVEDAHGHLDDLGVCDLAVQYLT